MKIDILNLKEGVTEYFESLGPSELDLLNLDFRLKDKAFVHTTVEKRGNKVKITIDAKFTLILTCSRCLEEFEQDFNTVDEYFVKPGQEELEPEKYLSDEDIFSIFAPAQEIDTTPLVRDSIILSVPMKPLCKEDCKGLCPVCGVNLNKSICEHVGLDKGKDEWQRKLEEIKKKLEKK